MSQSKFTKVMPLDPVMKKAKEVFAGRYFHWALEQARREAEGNFCNLHAIEAPAVFHFLEFCENNPPEISNRLLRALVRAAHSYAMSLTSDSLSDAELQLLQKYSGKQIARGQPVAVTGLSSQSYVRSMRGKFADDVPESVRKEIISSIEMQFSHREAVISRDGTSLELVERIGRWYITTHFACLAPGPAKMAYEHRISPFPYGGGTVFFYLGRSERPSHGISILDWLGIWPMTNWMSLPEGFPGQIGVKVAGMAKLFLAEVPKLLDGIVAPSHS